MVLADTELDAEDVPACCATNYAAMRAGAWAVAVNIGDTMYCPDCEGQLILDTDGRWRWAGE